ncbi:MAG: hypothetical protein H7Z42_12845 [Roseiflexaceae bacterium]|nr:hypothetical protein [Roseiflexaceae bacterium]
MDKPRLIEVENIHHPDSIRRVQADKYEAMKHAYLKILPTIPPGLSGAQILEQVVAHLPEDLFPGGAKAGWWAAAVQLDLEAKGIIKREQTSPIRLYRIVGVFQGD